MRHGLIIALCAFTACKKEPPPDPVPPTAAEAEAFATKVAAAIQVCDIGQLDAVLDVDRMLDRVLAGRRISSDEERGFRRGFKGTFGGKSMCLIGPTANKNSSARWLHLAPNSSNPILRLLSDDGINYLELVLDKQGDQIRIVDLYPYTLGEMMSHSFAAMLDTSDNATSSDAGKLKQIRTYMASNQPKEALAAIHQLPADWQQSKMVVVIEVSAAAQTGDNTAYLAAIDKFTRTFPNDPALDLIEIDGAFMRKEFKHELEILDRLDRHIGGDPYLDAMRATAYAELGELPKAVEHAKRASQKVPEVQEVWWGLLSLQASTDDHAGAIQSLVQLRDRFKVPVGAATLEADPRFTKLVASKQFQDWAAKP